ncbi:MAG: hypothetical protein K6G61_01985 [Solobacterium sp.]|nr:hypothetical protein [Solobacterium sp.]
MKYEVRRFKAGQIDESVIHALESAAADMPGFSGQPYFFTFFTNPGTLQALAELADTDLCGAPLVIAAFCDPAQPEAAGKTMMTLGGMALKLQGMSLACVFTDAFCGLFNAPESMKVRQMCGIPAGYICTGALKAGEADIQTEAERHFNVFSYIR